jgi:hypothetical protein
MKVTEILDESFLDALQHHMGGMRTSKMDIVDLAQRAKKLPPSLQLEVEHIIELMKNCRTFKQYQHLDMLKRKLEQQLRSNSV